MGTRGAPNLEVAGENLRVRSFHFMSRLDLCGLAAIWLGEPFKDSKTEELFIMVGMDLIIAMPIFLAPLVSDYSRFAMDSKRSFWGTWVGYFIISSWMYLIGLMASMATQSPDPSGEVMNLMLKFGWAMPALTIVLFSTFTTTFLDIYSTAVSGLNIVPKIGERKGVILGGILGRLLPSSFQHSQL